MTTAALDLDRLYRDHGHVVLRRAKHILGNETEAGEVLQQVFMSLVERPGQFRGDSSVTTFLYAMTTNACLNRLRSSRRRTVLIEKHFPAGDGQPAVPPAETMAAAQLLARLPDRLAKIAVYYFVDEMTRDEIADLIGVSRRQVGNLINQMLEEARRCAKAA
jgi:RNA polymerase sigma factor (sigma-70 family)